MVTLFETEPKIVPSLNATDGLDSGRRTDESTINFQWNVGDSLDGTSITTIDNSTKVIDSALLTTMTFDNLRDCPEISDDCPVGGPRLYISLDEGATFTSTNLPLQVLPGYYLYIRGNVINVSLAATLTLHGYINKV